MASIFDGSSRVNFVSALKRHESDHARYSWYPRGASRHVLGMGLLVFACSLFVSGGVFLLGRISSASYVVNSGVTVPELDVTTAFVDDEVQFDEGALYIENTLPGAHVCVDGGEDVRGEFVSCEPDVSIPRFSLACPGTFSLDGVFYSCSLMQVGTTTWYRLDGFGGDVSLYEYLDSDGDTFDDRVDNCPLVENRSQTDWDFDGEGDLCDQDTLSDSDRDGVLIGEDLCPNDAGPRTFHGCVSAQSVAIDHYVVNLDSGSVSVAPFDGAEVKMYATQDVRLHDYVRTRPGRRYQDLFNRESIPFLATCLTGSGVAGVCTNYLSQAFDSYTSLARIELDNKYEMYVGGEGDSFAFLTYIHNGIVRHYPAQLRSDDVRDIDYIVPLAFDPSWGEFELPFVAIGQPAENTRFRMYGKPDGYSVEQEHDRTVLSLSENMYYVDYVSLTRDVTYTEGGTEISVNDIEMEPFRFQYTAGGTLSYYDTIFAYDDYIVERVLAEEVKAPTSSYRVESVQVTPAEEKSSLWDILR